MKKNKFVNSPNWHEHTNDHGFKWLGMQPTSTTFDKIGGNIVMQFCDDQAGAGLQIVMSRQSFNDFLLLISKVREKLELEDG